MKEASQMKLIPSIQSITKQKINLFFLIDFIEWNFISFDGINLKDIITVSLYVRTFKNNSISSISRL